MALEIRPEIPADIPAIFELNRRAFDSYVEPRLIDQLRDDGDILVSLVAEHDSGIVGHILFTELPIDTEQRIIRAAALAPMAVDPGRQRSGIGSHLVRSGIDACRRVSVEAIVVLGHAEYYPRFGFTCELAKGLDSPYAGPHYMALELVERVLTGVRGRPRYAKAFEGL